MVAGEILNIKLIDSNTSRNMQIRKEILIGENLV